MEIEISGKELAIEEMRDCPSALGHSLRHVCRSIYDRLWSAWQTCQTWKTCLTNFEWNKRIGSI